MKKVSLYTYLAGNSYPGRGILIGRNKNDQMYIAYFIMGRSTNSRNRVFVEEGDGIRTEAFDPSKMVDPSLIIYAPVRVLGDKTIVTNGDQTDTIYDFLKEGKSFEEALRTRTFEPDAPNYTPRISGIVCGSSYELAIIKSAVGDPESVRRYFFEYNDERPGAAHIIHTYLEDGNPIPSYEGEPRCIDLSDDFDTFAERTWDALNRDNKVSLFCRCIDLNTNEVQTKIFNKNQ